MKTTPEIEADIVRLHYAEHWPVGTIATQLETHPDVVSRVLGFGEHRAPSRLRPRIFEPFRAFIDDTLSRYPKLLSTRLYDMVRERGYRGSGAVGTSGGGIGLSIVRRLCELYGWQVAIAPRPESGAEATLAFA